MTNEAFFIAIPGLLVLCLVATILLESVLARLLQVRRHDLLVVVLANIITNPIAVIVSLLVNSAQSILPILIIEIIVVIVEGILYKIFFNDYKKLSPFLLSLILNMFSFTIGLILFTYVFV